MRVIHQCPAHSALQVTASLPVGCLNMSKAINDHFLFKGSEWIDLGEITIAGIVL